MESVMLIFLSSFHGLPVAKILLVLHLLPVVSFFHLLHRATRALCGTMTLGYVPSTISHDISLDKVAVLILTF
jgi:hypothetical protein